MDVILYSLLASVSAAVVIFIIFTSFVMVRERSFKTTLWLGSGFNRVLTPGFHLKFPWPLEMVDAMVSTRIRELPVTSNSLSSDKAKVGLRVKVQYVPMEGKYYEAAYTLDNAEGQISSYIDNLLRAEITKYTVDAIFAETKKFEDVIEHELTDQFSKCGYRILNVLVDQPIISDQMQSAFEQKLVAERKRDAAEAEGEAVRIKMTKQADAEGESLIIKAEAFKKMRTLIAEGNGEAMKSFMESLEDGSIKERDVLDFFSNLDMREAMRDASQNGGRVVFVAGQANQGPDISSLIAAVNAGTDPVVLKAKSAPTVKPQAAQ